MGMSILVGGHQRAAKLPRGLQPSVFSVRDSRHVVDKFFMFHAQRHFVRFKGLLTCPAMQSCGRAVLRKG